MPAPNRLSGLQYAVVNSGSKVSGDIVARSPAKGMALFSPVVTSGSIYLQGNYDTTSAGFVRITDPYPDPAAGAADDGHRNAWRWAVSAGSKAIAIDPIVTNAFPYFRLEFDNAQADTRTITVLLHN